MSTKLDITKQIMGLTDKAYRLELNGGTMAPGANALRYAAKKLMREHRVSLDDLVALRETGYVSPEDVA